MSKARLRQYIDYLFPREVLGAVVLVFALENVTETIIVALLPATLHVWAWLAVFVLASLFFAYWGDVDEHDDNDVTNLSDVFEDDDE